jgi:hypothetical protein
MKLQLLVSVTSLFLILGCKRDLGPEDSLREYVDYAVSGNVTKDGFLSRSTGDLLSMLEMMDPDEFNEYAKEMAHVDRRRLRINSSQCDGDRCALTYTVNYNSQSEGKATYSIEVRKIAELVQEDSRWKLASITNVKSHYDGKEITEEDFKKQNHGLTPDEVNQLRR